MVPVRRGYRDMLPGVTTRAGAYRPHNPASARDGMAGRACYPRPMRWPFRKADERPRWDQKLAGKLEGATVLVGITYHEPTGDRQEQFFGIVISADPEQGVLLRLEGSRAGDVRTLPPDLGAFSPAAPGAYRLRETGEVVTDPDYTSSWSITPPQH